MIERIAIITICSIIFFWKTLKYKYVSDDIPVFLANKDKKYKWYQRIFLQLRGDIRVTEKQDHAITLAIHTLCSVFLYTGLGANDISFFAALLFCFNPANNQGSVWISGRGYAYPVLYFLAALTLPFFSPVFLYASAFFHAGFLSSIIFAFSDYWWFLLFMPVIWYLRWKNFSYGVSNKIKKEMFTEDKKIHPSKLILFFKTLGFYFTLTLIPFKNTFYHSFMQSLAGNDIMRKRAYKIDHFFFIGISVCAGFGWYILTHRDMYSFMMVWFIVSVAPFCNLFRVSQEIAERYMYLPSVGLMYLLASITLNYPILYTAILTMYATRMWFYMDAYRDDYFIAEVACINSPDAWFSWHIRAMKRWETCAVREALHLWTMAKILSPKEFKVLFNIANVLSACRNEKDAESILKEAMDNVPAGQEQQAKQLYEAYRKGKRNVLL